MNPNSPKSPWLMPLAGQGNLFNYLPDELVVHICCYMDSYSMLKFGRSSSRLYNVVCSPELWRRLLSGIEEFSEAKVRMLMFFAKKGDFLQMMTEVLREIASRHIFSKGQDIVRVKVTIGGWSKEKSYNVSSDALKKMIQVEKESGARMIMNEVKESEGSRRSKTCRTRFVGYIGDHLNIQQVQLEYFEVGEFTGNKENLHILRCQNWLIHELWMANWFNHQLTAEQVKNLWRYLASNADRGQITMLMLCATASRSSGTWSIYEEILESVRKVWEISDNVKIRFANDSRIEYRGGRSNGNREDNWQEIVAALHR